MLGLYGDKAGVCQLRRSAAVASRFLSHSAFRSLWTTVRRPDSRRILRAAASRTDYIYIYMYMFLPLFFSFFRWMQAPYIDLLLIHFPFVIKPECVGAEGPTCNPPYVDPGRCFFVFLMGGAFIAGWLEQTCGCVSPFDVERLGDSSDFWSSRFDSGTKQASLSQGTVPPSLALSSTRAFFSRPSFFGRLGKSSVFKDNCGVHAGSKKVTCRRLENVQVSFGPFASICLSSVENTEAILFQQ